MTPLVELADVERDAYTLAANNSLVEDLRSALSSGERAHELVPGLLDEVMETGAWLDRRDRGGNRYSFDPTAFAEFIEAPLPRGLGTTPEVFEKYIGNDETLRLAFNASLKFEHGGNRNPYGCKGAPQSDNQDFGIKFDNVNLDSAKESSESAFNNNHQVEAEPEDRGGVTSVPAVIGVVSSVAIAQPEKRQPFQGNSAGYAARRLSKNRPDLFERVLSGELSCHAAMIEAGFRTRTITVPIDPEQAAPILRRAFTADQLETILALALEREGVSGS